MPVAMAIAAHPDDIEFGMAGTLLLLRRVGFALHYLNLADGCCGTVQYDAPTIAAIRLKEARAAAQLLGAIFYPPLVRDIEIFYEKSLLAQVAALVRKAAPDIILTHSPQDYMEDHQNTCRLAVTAAICRGMPNFATEPPQPPLAKDIVVYHAQPADNRDGLGRFVRPSLLVDISAVIEEKAALLAEHRSQKDWLDRSQGANAYIEGMRRRHRELGMLSGRFAFAEGWRRHHHLGFCAPDADPLSAALGAAVLRLADANTTT
ncbi:MAG: PIG-L family deacetylase [Planctomycetota bacterium]|nr:PIG-L family deacetylase [Planctomycetota bacterium]